MLDYFVILSTLLSFMKRIFSTLLLTGLFVLPLNAEGRLDSLLGVLDRTLEQRDKFKSELEGTISRVRDSLNEPLTPRERYRINKKLVDLYHSYIYDSAMLYIALNHTIASTLADKQLLNENSIDYSKQLLSGGIYHEAIESIKSIPRRELSGDLLLDYWLTYEQIYHHMSLYATGSSFEGKYKQICKSYTDSLGGGALGPDSKRYLALSRIYLNNPDTRIAQVRLRNLLDRLTLGSHNYAIVAAALAETYDEHDVHEREQKIELLVASAISDIKSNVKEYVSLSRLGSLLYLSGDVERAYRYGEISMEDANFYNARLRRIEMSRIFPIIESTYKQMLTHQNSRLKSWGITISLLAILMLVLILFIVRQTTALLCTRRELLKTNQQLVEASRVKEEYLGRFLSMCSSYINRLEHYQNIVHTKLISGKVEEVRIMTRSSDVIDREISEFYSGFDKAFVRLYPNFTAELNSLLRDDEQIKPCEGGERLPVEVRICALVKLGISNPVDIAKFLRYSVNTVYAYRHKVKSKAKNGETFERDIANIGI
jgi:hypothetical protein